jgi:gliding motility-associated-like protein
LGFVDILNVWPGKYQLSVTDANLCNILQDFEILSKPCPPVIIIPNIFSPNGDGRNDYFEFTAERVASFNATILNRWGEEIYTWHKGMEAWNGESGLGSKAPEGSYFYLIYIVGEDGSSAMFKGPLLLTRISN